MQSVAMGGALGVVGTVGVVVVGAAAAAVVVLGAGGLCECLWITMFIRQSMLQMIKALIFPMQKLPVHSAVPPSALSDEGKTPLGGSRRRSVIRRGISQGVFLIDVLVHLIPVADLFGFGLCLNRDAEYDDHGLNSGHVLGEPFDRQTLRGEVVGVMGYRRYRRHQSNLTGCAWTRIECQICDIPPPPPPLYQLHITSRQKARSCST